ncbi:MAG TPA: APC family permease [Vicinamibacteria bacterium]|nr:APC family permease [Vicinamibacteria bacterium]
MDSSFIRPGADASRARREASAAPPRRWRTWLFGRPLPTADAPHQAIGKAVGLAVFSSDALSSTAYATQEMMMILAVAGTAALGRVFPISIAIAVLLAIVTISYEQTIHAYPGGGGAYIVARDNLGELPAQVAGAALLMDYILTVAVSVSSGVAQVVSAFPVLFSHRTALSVALVLFVMVVNLRGVKESGRVFAVPTYFFVFTMYLTVGVAFVRHAFSDLGTVPDPPPLEVGEAQALGLFLLLHAFSSGTTALTGVEAISNGIPAFREPRSQNAGITLLWMSTILGTLFLGISYLAGVIGAVPSEHETVISQLARTTFGGRGSLYLATIAATTLILVMAANTAYADFPRLGALQAADGFLPRQLTYRGSRLVFSRGIVLLALIASTLIVVFDASVTGLIPLYAIGVFLSFTLSQAGMVHRWWKIGHLEPGKEVRERGSVLRHERGWLHRMLVNGVGAVLTAVVTLVFAITKFHDGAWVVILVIPSLVVVFFAIHRHYRDLARRLSLERFGPPPRVDRHRVILPISGIHRGVVAGLTYARALSEDVTAVYVSTDPAQTEAVEQKWGLWGGGVRLVVVNSPYRLLVEPLVEYIRQVAARRQPNEVITVVVPQFVPRRQWHNALHAQTAMMLRLALVFEPGVVITSVPYQVGLEEEGALA